MDLRTFFLTHPVFTSEELAQFQCRKGSTSRWTRKALLAHHRKQGHVVNIRRGLYAAVPPGATPEECPVDPVLIAAKLREDAVLAYHTALDFHGRAHSVFHQFYFLTRRPLRQLSFRSYTFTSVIFPKALQRKGQENYGVKTRERDGMPIRVASLERTLVDVLDRPELGGGWEEAWRSLESVEFFDLDVVVAYALLLGNATTSATVGYFLEQHRNALMVEDAHLEPLLANRPKQPHYLKRSGRNGGRLVTKWNLIVPDYVAERTWEEPA